MTKKELTIGALIVVLAIVIGVSVWSEGHNQIATASPAGTTGTTAKFASVTWAMTSATSSSVLNSDASDRDIIAIKYGCNSVGTSFTAYTGVPLTSAGLTLKAATTSTIASASLLVSNTNNVVSTSIATSTASSGFLTLASSTMAIAGSAYFNQVWLAGSYLTFFTNATNTAACTIGVEYLPT